MLELFCCDHRGKGRVKNEAAQENTRTKEEEHQERMRTTRGEPRVQRKELVVESRTENDEDASRTGLDRRNGEDESKWKQGQSKEAL